MADHAADPGQSRMGRLGVGSILDQPNSGPQTHTSRWAYCASLRTRKVTQTLLRDPRLLPSKLTIAAVVRRGSRPKGQMPPSGLTFFLLAAARVTKMITDSACP